MMDTGRYALIIAAIALGLVAHGLMFAPQPSLLAEMFPTRMRYSGVSLGYQVTAIFAGSLAPIIAVRLLQTYRSSVPIAIYLAGAAVITFDRAGIRARVQRHRPGQCRCRRRCRALRVCIVADPTLTVLVLLGLAAVAAGFVDAVVGGAD